MNRKLYSIGIASLGILFSENAYSCIEDKTHFECKDITHIESCIPLDQFGKVQQFTVSDNETLVTVHDKDASGVYNPAYRVYLLDKKNGELIGILQDVLVYVDVDIKNFVLTSFRKGRGLGDIGHVVFYKLDVENKKLIVLKRFETDNLDPPDGQYADENKKNDKPCGYMQRAKAYAKEQHFNLTVIESLQPSDACIN